ncbi:unnamed protein product [Triticum turgidum subsp. durum]|uniref:RNase H type-1 domain-containing protein n=1 Tax=Triticum turgidum subsp. durum TaxID=4567 RepID=A0A9R0UV71_TRITD|nr:unnamed protein product [Triticum turgidum subsp. durum]
MTAWMILRRHNGSIIFAAYRYISSRIDTLKVKIHALMQGMTFAIQYFNLSVIVQSDSGVALSSLTGDGLIRSVYGHLVTEIKTRGRKFISQKLNRDQNKVVDRLTN